MVVGTHALIEPDVAFDRLAVCVVDEQHRFGVRQRAALDAKGPDGAAPHALHMTATPIPRTLSLTAYGDLDATVLRELPAARRARRHMGRGGGEALRRIRVHPRPGCARGARPMSCVRWSSTGQGGDPAGRRGSRRGPRRRRRSAADAPIRRFEVGLLHGQLPAARKQAAMERFASGRTQVLVATSVIEVGIDVANATVMLVEGAERFGLSQLHQLRGRVGRGEHASQCILFARLRLRARAAAPRCDRRRARRIQAR